MGYSAGSTGELLGWDIQWVANADSNIKSNNPFLSGEKKNDGLACKPHGNHSSKQR